MADVWGSRRRPGRGIGALATAGLAVTLAGCLPGGPPAPARTTVVVTVTPAPSPTPSAEPPSASPTPSATRDAVKATGTMSLFSLVTEKLVGTCGTVDGEPTLTLADHANDFFETVDLSIVLTPDRNGVSVIAAEFGGDSEEITRELRWQAAKPVKGTSAAFTAKGATYRVSGKAQVVEDDEGAKTTSLIPYAITVTCAAGAWGSS